MLNSKGWEEASLHLTLDWKVADLFLSWVVQTLPSWEVEGSWKVVFFCFVGIDILGSESFPVSGGGFLQELEESGGVPGR